MMYLLLLRTLQVVVFVPFGTKTAIFNKKGIKQKYNPIVIKTLVLKKIARYLHLTLQDELSFNMK